MLKISKVPAFGFQTPQIQVHRSHAGSALTNNIRKIIGYIPGLGIIQGIEHIVRAIKDRRFSPHFIIRGVLETLCLGLLLLLPDLIIMAINCRKAMENSLVGRKVLPVHMPTPTPPVSQPAFPEAVATFIAEIPRPANSVPLAIPPKKVVVPTPLTFKEFRVGFLKAAKQDAWTKQQTYLYKRFLPYVDQHKEQFKQMALDLAKQSAKQALILLEKLVENNVFPDEQLFLQKLGVYIAHFDKSRETLIAKLHQPKFLTILDYKNIWWRYAHKVGLNLALLYTPYKDLFGPGFGFQLGKEAVRTNPYLVLNQAHLFGLTQSSIFSFAKKQGDLMTRLEKALKEVTQYHHYPNGTGIFDNLPYYGFNETNLAEYAALRTVVAHAFAQKPEAAIAGMTSVPIKATSFYSEVFLEAAKKETSEGLFVFMCGGGQKCFSEDFIKEFLKIYAAKRPHYVAAHIRHFTLTPQSLREILEVSMQADQWGTINNLKDYGVPDNFIREMSLYLFDNFGAIKGTLKERYNKALEAAKRNPTTLAANISFYLDFFKPEEERYREEIAVACLTHGALPHILPHFYEAEEDQMQVIMLAASEISNPHFIHYLQGYSTAFLHEFALNAKARLVLETMNELRISPQDEQGRRIIVQVAGVAIKQDIEMFIAHFKKMKWDFHDDKQFSTYQVILKAIIQESGDTFVDELGIVWETPHGQELGRIIERILETQG